MDDLSNISKITDLVEGIDNIETTDKLMTYVDRYVTEEQKKRDQDISKLLNQYLLFYIAKTKDNRIYKCILYIVCIFSMLLFSSALCFIVYKFLNKDKLDMSATTQLISACITFLSLIFGILTIITKYVFPKGDEDYITRNVL